MIMARKLFSRRILAAVGAVAIAGTVLAGCSSTSSSSSGGSAALTNLTLGSPGIPPVISGLLPYIASKQGFYKKYGLNVTIKSFATGTDATRAAATGQIDVAIMPPAQIVQLAAAGSQLVGIQGQEFPDWVVVSTDPSVNSCASLKGQSIGVDAIGGIRYIALLQMLRTCNLAITDVHPLAFAGNANPAALVAGQLKVSVLHLNEVYSVESQGKTLTTAIKMSTAVPNTMYEMYGTTKAALAKNRPAYVKLVAAQIAAINWMNNPKNAAAVAQYATVTGGTKSDLTKAMAQYRALDFWSTKDASMPELNVNNMIQSQIKAGNITAAKAPTYAAITDLTVFTDAEKLVAKNGD
ncbi:MAG: NitT/TauT family transport system substrate-binding protein [Actinomycetota bacterium]|jgi:NitT/TauT family transport system substrate-binding protein|nr:NitT/TauT family transport system substrate-binding protein [Actinomycetota bacterium]